MASVDALVRTDYKPVDKRDELHVVLGWLMGDTTKVPVVLDGERPFGIINERALMSRKLEQRARLEGFTLTTRALPRAASLKEAAARMGEFRAAYLPIEDGRGKCAGYVSALDVARETEITALARDLCLPVAALQETQSMGEALHAFTQEYVDVLPVMDDGRVVGVLPRRQIVRMEWQTSNKGRKDALGEKITLLRDPISGWMDSTAVTVKPTAGFDEVVEELDEHGYAIVQDGGGGVLGLITPEVLMRTGGLDRTP